MLVHLSALIISNKIFNRPVIGSLGIGCEKAGWQFAHAPVIRQAFTAFTLARARFVGAIATILVGVKVLAFHEIKSILGKWFQIIYNIMSGIRLFGNSGQ
jgi:hypothetical protein